MRRSALTIALCAAVGLGALRAAPQPGPGPALPASMAAAVLVAAHDAAQIDPETAARVRYFYDPEPDFELREENFAMLSFQLNALSRGPNISRPLRIAAYLYRIDLGNYKMDPVVFANARVDDTYFHTPVRGPDGKIEHAVPGYLPQAELDYLAKRLQSPAAAVIYRADWFVHRTGIQEDRDGFGYYDFLGLKSGKDVDDLAGHNEAAAEKEYAELAAMIRVPGVSIYARQVFRYGLRRGCYWETRDPDRGRGDSNATSRLFKDFKFAGKEIVFTLPNGLAGYALENDKGDLVKSGPPQLVGDKRPSFNGNDARVHVGAGCITCHGGGALRPLSDYGRRVFVQGRSVALGSPDKDLAERIKRVYLGPLQEAYEKDTAAFSKAYTQASGIPAVAVPRTYAAVWNRFTGDVTSARAAVELDTTKECLRAALAWQAKSGKGLDLSLAGLVGPEADEEPVSRDVFEEAYPLLRAILAEWERAGKPGH